MEIRQTVDELTGRVQMLIFIPQKFMDQRILKGLSQAFVEGGEIHITTLEGYEATIELPGPADTLPGPSDPLNEEQP